MAKPDQLARPVMRCPACLHADQTGRQLREEGQYLPAAQRLADDNIAHRINTVNLKNAFGQIQADRDNLHDGWLPWLVVALTASTIWHSDAGSGSHPHHLL